MFGSGNVLGEFVDLFFGDCGGKFDGFFDD